MTPTREAELDFGNDRYASLKLIDWFDALRVRQARVLVVGAGAIGNEVLKNLALLGVGNIYILDRDTIEMSNLSRSILFREKDRGQSKAMTAAHAVREVNPGVNAYWRHGDIETSLGEGFVHRMDVVIGCLDSLEARFLLNRVCWRAGRPWVDAGIGPLNGQVRVFQPPAGPCYECSFQEDHYRQIKMAMPCNAVAGEQARRGRIPTTPTIASLVAAVQVQETLKLLDQSAWNGRTLAGRQFIFNGTVGEAEVVGLAGRPDCPAHDTIESDSVVSCPNLSAAHPSGDALAQAREILGPAAYLYLNSEIAIERRCPKCQARTPVLAPVGRLEPGDLVCGECGNPCSFESDLETTHIIDARSVPQIRETALSTLGVPRFGWIEARNREGEYRYLELSGDAATIVEAEGNDQDLNLMKAGSAA